MPKIDDIDKLKDIVDSLGNEKDVRQKRGEAIEPVAPPDQELSPDLSDLLNLGGGETLPPGQEAGTEAGAALDGVEDAKIDDLSKALEETAESEPVSEETMGLDVLPETFGEEAAAGEASAAEAAEVDTSALDGFELPDFGSPGEEAPPDTAEAAPVEETAEAMPDLAGALGAEETIEAGPEMAEVMPETAEAVPEMAEAMPPEGESPAVEPTFDLSDFQTNDLSVTGEEVPVTGEEGPSAGAEQMFDTGAEIPVMEGAGETVEAGPEEGVPALDQFELPDFSELGGAAEPPPVEPGAVETPAAPEAETGPGVGGLEEGLFDMPEGEAQAAPLGEEAVAFDSFEMPDLSEIEGQAGAASTPTGPAAAAPGVEMEPPPAGAEDEGLDDIGSQEFELPDFGKAAGPAPAGGAGPAVEPGFEGGAGPMPELAGADEERQYSERDFENIRATLAILPLNLKIAVEELIGEKDLRGPKLKRLLESLIAGESPKAIAAIVSGITGQKIVLPKSFEKKSGIAYEREKDSFAYFLRTKGWKAAVIMGLVFVVLIVLGVGAYHTILLPMSALPVYNEGYQAVQENRFETGKQKFEEARRLWDSKDQYYRFAEAFISSAAGNYFYAADIYKKLLAKYPGDVKGIIDYARLETLQKNYDRAEALLVDDLLIRDMYNFDGLAACAANYLAWAEDDYSKIKDAEFYYNTLAEHYRDRTAAHLQRLAYYISSERLAREKGNADFDNTNRVLGYAAFLKKKGYDVVDPVVYTATAGYLIDKDEADFVPELLDKSRAAAPGYAPAYYEYARYFRLAGEPEKERAALEQAIEYFKEPAAGTPRNFQIAGERLRSLERSAMLVLASGRLGDYYLEQGKPERAEGLLLDAQRLFEQYRERLLRTRFAADGAFGRLYYSLGNISLLAGNDGRALDLYRGAEENGFTSPDQTYKKGFIHYRQKDFDGALVEFHKANGDLPDNETVLFALATTEYRRARYAIAEGYYLYLIGVLGKKKDALPEIRVEDNPVHRDLITNLYLAYNNIGCAEFKLSTSPADRRMTEAENFLRKASELYDVMTRDPDTLARLEETTIAARVGKKEIVKGKGVLARYLKAPTPFYNLDVIFHGKADSVVLGEKIDVLIYELVPRTIDSPKLLAAD